MAVTLESVLRRFRSLRRSWDERLSLPSNVTGEPFVRPRRGLPLVDRFAGLFSVLHEDESRGVFLLNEGGSTPPDALGCVFELVPGLWFSESGARLWESILQLDLPARSTVAASLYASPCVGGMLSDYVQAHSMASPDASGRLLAEMARRKSAMLEDLARTGALAGHAAPVRNFRCWLAFTSRVGTAEILSLGVDGAWAPRAKQFLSAVASAEAALAQFGLLECRWNRPLWQATLRELSNPHKAAAGKLLHPAPVLSNELRSEAVDRDTFLDVGRTSLTFSSPGVPPVHGVVLGVTSLPADVHVNDMGSLLGAASQAGAALADPYLVTTVVEPTDRAEDASAVAVKAARVKQLQWTEIGRYLPDLAERERDLEIARAACAKNGGLARMALSMTVFSRHSESLAVSERAGALLREAGFTGFLDAGLQAAGFLSCLPCEAGHALMRDLRTAHRTVTVTREAAAHCLPVLGQWRGSGARAGELRATPLLLFATRHGQLFGIDLFANRAGNYNAVVCGRSGSGKSVLAQDLVLSQVAGGGRAWVFDIGESYKHCARLANGQWIDFEKEEGLCINPLAIADDPEDCVAELGRIVAVLAGSGDLDPTTMALLQEGILQTHAWAKSQGVTPTLTMLCVHLAATAQAEGRPELRDLVTRLRPYCAGGHAAKWFEGPATVEFERALVVLEMQGLANKPELQEAVLLILILRILQEIRRAPRSQKKLVVIDEGWRLLQGRSGDFIEWACRTLRKYGAGIVCLTQNYTDLLASPAADAMRTNADTVFLLRQDDRSVDAYTRDPWTASQIRSLTTQAGVFSEVFVRQGDGPGAVGRLYLDPFAMKVFSTRAEVFESVDRATRGLGGEELARAVDGLLAGESR